MNRLKLILNAIDEIYKAHNTPRPVNYGGGVWDYDEEISIYIDSLIKGEEMADYPKLTAQEWKFIHQRISHHRKNIKC